MDPAGTRSAALAPPPAPTRGAATDPTDHRVERRMGGPRADEPAVACRAAGLRTVAPVGRADGHRMDAGRCSAGGRHTGEPRVAVWDVRTGALVATSPPAGSARGEAVRFTPDGAAVLFGRRR